MACGLPQDLAQALARATVAGSGALAASSEEPVEVLRQNVTSPGGTTQAALAVLMAADGIQPLFDPRDCGRRAALTRARLTGERPMAHEHEAGPDLVAAAFALIGEEGWRGFSFAALARRTGVSRVEIYRQFRTREALLGAPQPARRRGHARDR